MNSTATTMRPEMLTPPRRIRAHSLPLNCASCSRRLLGRRQQCGLCLAQRCRKVRCYCGVPCQRAHWPQHSLMHQRRAKQHLNPNPFYSTATRVSRLLHAFNPLAEFFSNIDPIILVIDLFRTAIKIFWWMVAMHFAWTLFSAQPAQFFDMNIFSLVCVLMNAILPLPAFHPQPPGHPPPPRHQRRPGQRHTPLLRRRWKYVRDAPLRGSSRHGRVLPRPTRHTH